MTRRLDSAALQVWFASRPSAPLAPSLTTEFAGPHSPFFRSARTPAIRKSQRLTSQRPGTFLLEVCHEGVRAGELPAMSATKGHRMAYASSLLESPPLHCEPSSPPDCMACSMLLGAPRPNHASRYYWAGGAAAGRGMRPLAARAQQLACGDQNASASASARRSSSLAGRMAARASRATSSTARNAHAVRRSLV